jgi:hypothetical protein
MLFITLGDGLIGPSPVSANPLTDQTNRTNRGDVGPTEMMEFARP